MGDLGFAWDKTGAHWGGVVEVDDPALQTAIADLRASGLNVMMSMKEEGKPVSFVEDCAVPLEHLAEYTERLTRIFEKHGTRGTWYAHAALGCLHVRPVLNLRLDKDVNAMRAIAEEAFAMVREYKGSHSGEHGDGIVRSEFHAQMFGERIVGRLRGGEGPLRSDGPVQPRPHRARAQVRRPTITSATAPAITARRSKGSPRLVRLHRRGRRIPGRRRDVQQQRRLPQIRRAASCARAIASPARSAT